MTMDFTFSDILADMHVHTNFTAGGMSTIRENLALARRRGLGFIATVNHISDCSSTDFKSVNALKTDSGVHVISGANVSTLTTSAETLEQLNNSYTKLRTLTLNPDCGPNLISAENFIDRIESAIDFYGITYLCELTEFTHLHIPAAEHRRFSSLLANLCDKRHLTVELNSVKKDDAELFMLIKILEDCAEKDVSYAIGSKALYCEDIGDLESTVLFVENFNIKKARVLNCDKETLTRLSVDYQPAI